MSKDKTILTAEQVREIRSDYALYCKSTTRDALCDTIDALREELEDAALAQRYARDLFTGLAPQCEPLTTVSGLISQLDNYISGVLDQRDTPQKRVDALLIANSQEVEKRREAERMARMAATSTMLHANALNDIAEHVALKEGNLILWLEPEAVTEAVRELSARAARLEVALRETQFGNQTPSHHSPEIIFQLCPVCEQEESLGHSPDCLVGAALSESTEERGV